MDIPRLVCAADVTPSEPRWLWCPFIPYEYVTILAGDGGMGKSSISCDIAARISTGAPFPGQSEGRAPSRVVMLSSEEDMSQIIVPRLMKMEADLNNIYLVNDVFKLNEEGCAYLEAMMEKADAAVVFVDALLDYTGANVDIYRANEVRAFGNNLKRITKETGCATILVCHLNKDNKKSGMGRIMGSADFVNASRSTIMVEESPSGDRHMRLVKGNYAGKPEPISYSFDEDGNFHWGDWVRPWRVSRKSSPAVVAAKKWLTNKLESGPLHSLDIMEDAEVAGISKAVLNTAKLGVAESYRDSDLKWWWKLKTLPEGESK